MSSRSNADDNAFIRAGRKNVTYASDNFAPDRSVHRDRAGSVTRLRYWAAIREAAGQAEQQVEASTLAGALTVARDTHGARFATVLGLCAFVVDGAPVGARDHADVVLGEHALIDVLPPFAGG